MLQLRAESKPAHVVDANAKRDASERLATYGEQVLRGYDTHNASHK